jgi:hypothetical protein
MIHLQNEESGSLNLEKIELTGGSLPAFSQQAGLVSKSAARAMLSLVITLLIIQSLPSALDMAS